MEQQFVNFSQRAPIQVQGTVKAAPRWKLQVKEYDASPAGPVFLLDSDFLPVETYVIPRSTNWGTINGQSLQYKNLIKVFDLFENIAMLDQGLSNIDMSAFMMPAGVFQPEPGLAADLAANTYILFYLVKI